MVKIITGPINSGKTTMMTEVYRKTSKGDGFVSVKLMNGQTVVGFDMVRLSTGEKRPFIRRIGSEPEGWRENSTLGPYSFSDDAVQWVDRTIDILIGEGVFPIYLDEAGMLEADGKCLYKTIEKMIASDKDIYITARDNIAKEIVNVFDVSEAEFIKTGERYA